MNQVIGGRSTCETSCKGEEGCLVKDFTVRNDESSSRVLPCTSSSSHCLVVAPERKDMVAGKVSAIWALNSWDMTKTGTQGNNQQKEWCERDWGLSRLEGPIGSPLLETTVEGRRVDLWDDSPCAAVDRVVSMRRVNLWSNSPCVIVNCTVERRRVNSSPCGMVNRALYGMIVQAIEQRVNLCGDSPCTMVNRIVRSKMIDLKNNSPHRAWRKSPCDPPAEWWRWFGVVFGVVGGTVVEGDIGL